MFYSDFKLKWPIPVTILKIKKYNRVKTISFAFQSVSNRNYSKRSHFGQVMFILPVLNKLSQLLHVKFWSEKLKKWILGTQHSELIFFKLQHFIKNQFSNS